MTTPSKDPISVRNSHLQHILLGRRKLFEGEQDLKQLTKDGLIDALLVLYDECQTGVAKKDVPTVTFVEKYQPVVTKLKKLRVNVADFEEKKVIGRGHFGQVHLVKEKQTGDVYAMKVMKKTETLAKINTTFYEEEKDIMAKAKSEWITSLHCSFQDNDNLYLVMEYHPGGDLFGLLNRRDGILTEDEARFYLAEITVALNVLHTMGYVHRDVKPENVLLDRLGHVKLADFGSAARLDSESLVRAEMPVGTADYIAPEVLTAMNNVGLLAGGYGKECDYWSLGVLAYEMLFGKTPFSAEDIKITYANIMSFRKTLSFPEDTTTGSTDFRSFVKVLLTDAGDRSGYLQLVHHPFFNSIDWNGLRDKSPPHVPVISGLDDTSNFDCDFEEERPGLLSCTTADLAKSGTERGISRNLPFIGYTFVKEGSAADQIFTAGNDASPLRQRITELETDLKSKSREIAELRQQKLAYEQEKGKQWNVDLLNQKVSRLESERDILENQLKKARRDADQQRKGREADAEANKKTMEKVNASCRQMKSNFEQIIEKEKNDLRDELNQEIQIWKDAYQKSQSDAKEVAGHLKLAVEAGTKSMEKEKYWKEKAEKYKEMSLRGQRVNEKRASMCPPPPPTPVSLPDDIAMIRDLNERIRKLEIELKETVAKNKLVLEEEKERLITASTSHEDELRERIDELETKILRQKETKIQELEKRLESQLRECSSWKDRADKLQKTLDETAEWRCSFEMSFSTRESEMESRIRQLEADLRSATDLKLDLERQCAEASVLMATNHQKYEAVVLDMKEAVERMARRNQELEEEISSRGSESEHQQGAADEQLVQKITFLEEQIGKLEQKLEKVNANLTLEKEKNRTLEHNLYLREKELKDAQLDVRIGARETKTAEAEVAKLKESAKLFNSQLKAKDEEMESLRVETAKLKTELEEARQTLSDKEKAATDREKDLDIANKAASAAREHRREAQRFKDELAICQRLKGTVEVELKQAEDRLARHNEEKAGLLRSLEEVKAKVVEKEATINDLKDTMIMMDEQLQDFAAVVQGGDKKESEFEAEKTRLESEIERIKLELRTAKQQINEEKSLKLFTESRLKDVEGRLKSGEADSVAQISSLKEAVNRTESEAIQLKNALADIEDQLADTESVVDKLTRRVTTLEEENVQLQEESSALRTQLISLKNSNAQLSDGLSEAIGKGEAYKERIQQLDSALETAKTVHKEREHKFEMTLGQHAKLIDFLQAKTEQSGKKKTLTDKLFGSSGSGKKENLLPALGTPNAAYRDLEARMEKKNAQIRSLTDQLNRCKAELAAAKMETSSTNSIPAGFTTPAGKSTSARELGRIAGNVAIQAATPLPHRALSKLTQSPGTQQSSPSSLASSGESGSSSGNSRMHHNIPHRLQTHMVGMRATNCVVCLDSIHFGRQVSSCGDCGATVHTKCAPHLPSTCGLPAGLAQHFVQLGLSRTQSTSATPSQTSSSGLIQQGYVKIPRPGKAACWDRKFMKVVLDGLKLCIYDHEPTSDLMAPIDTFELRPSDGSTVSIHSAVPQSEVQTTAKTDVPYIFMLESVPKTTCWPGRTLFVMALSFPDKKAWVSALEKLIVNPNDSAAKSSRIAPIKPAVILSLGEGSPAPLLDVNCAVTITPGVLLLGTKEGLYSYHLRGGSRRPVGDLVRIGGVPGNVHQIVIVRKLSSVFMIVGEERQLVMTELPVAQGCADAVQTAQPTLEVTRVDGCEDVHLFEVSSSEEEGEEDRPVFLCAATQDRVKLFKWNNSGSFVLRKELIVSETCSCIHFARHSVLVGCDRFYEVDLGNYAAEEFLDASDSSLAYVVFGLKQIHSFPVAILDVTARRSSQKGSSTGEAEYLLCYHEFGIFVDGYGRRSRTDDVKWTRLPLAFSYRAPYLFVLHFNSVEVMRLTPESFKKNPSLPTPPVTVFVELPGPRFLGPAALPPNANYYLSQPEGGKKAEIVLLEASILLPDSTNAMDDDVSLSGSEFSITPSVAKILDDAEQDLSDDSNGSSPTAGPAFKRCPSSSASAGNSKRVKFESDL